MASDKKEKQEEVKKPTFIEVRQVRSHGKGVIVEWVEDGKAIRKVVPVKAVKDNQIEESILEKAPDYGVPWAKELKPNASPEDVEIALHNAGIWTSEDALNNPGGVIGALNAAYKTDLVAVLKASKKYINKE